MSVPLCCCFCLSFAFNAALLISDRNISKPLSFSNLATPSRTLLVRYAVLTSLTPDCTTTQIVDTGTIFSNNASSTVSSKPISFNAAIIEVNNEALSISAIIA